MCMCIYVGNSRTTHVLMYTYTVHVATHTTQAGLAGVVAGRAAAALERRGKEVGGSGQPSTQPPTTKLQIT